MKSNDRNYLVSRQDPWQGYRLLYHPRKRNLVKINWPDKIYKKSVLGEVIRTNRAIKYNPFLIMCTISTSRYESYWHVCSFWYGLRSDRTVNYWRLPFGRTWRLRKKCKELRGPK